jgi:hypothetical protein
MATMLSNKKGAQFERDIAKKLSLWLSDGVRDDLVWRTSASGARHTIRQKKGHATVNQAGDLCAQDPSVHYFFDRVLVECKSGYRSTPTKKQSQTIMIISMLDAPNAAKTPLLFGWWQKATKEKIASNKDRVMLIFRRTGKKTCLMIEKEWLLKLSHNKNGPYPYDSVLIKVKPYPLLVVCDFEQWLSWCEPHVVGQR